LAALAATRRTIAVAGSHGKTTTSSMLALILRGAGWQPSFVIGGEVNEVGANAAFGNGEWLVVEADESDGTFLRLRPRPRS
jgi:UDP-N-acetylmuramate--alanine ligase